MKCLAPRCAKEIKPERVRPFCRKHWFMLPRGLRSDIWFTVRFPHEEGKLPKKRARDYTFFIESALEILTRKGQ